MSGARKAVVLLSGGLDSTTTLAIAKHEGFEPYALTFRYGQRHEVEIEAAHRVARTLGVADHRVAEIDLRLFGGSALTDDIDVPKGRSADEMGTGIPVTYVPARNTIFLSFALAWAEVLGASDIFLGVNALDYCLPATTDVMTDRGLTTMERLRVGDRVLSYGADGMSWKRVVFHAQSPYQETMLRIRCGGNIFDCTPNHHMVRVDFEKKYRLLTNKRVAHVQAHELNVGDYLLTPAQEIDVEDIDDEFDFTPYAALVQWPEERLTIRDGMIGRVTGVRNFLPLRCRLEDVLVVLAWYVTEGWMTNCNGICISQQNPTNIAAITKAITALGLKPHVEKKSSGETTIFFSHPVIAYWLRTLGGKARDKRLPDWCLGLPNRLLSVLFEGLIKADGSWQRRAKLYGRAYDHYYCDFYSSSETLLKQTIYIATRLGYRSSVQKTCKSGTYSVRFTKPRSRKLNGGSLIQITSIDEVPTTEPLYDVTVEQNHTLVAGTFGFIIAGQSGYPDCRPEFVEAFERLANLATKAGVEGTIRLKIHTPLISLSKAEIVSRGLELGVDYGMTTSCYDPSPEGAACGACDACLLRLKGFAENGLPDPAQYIGAEPGA